MTFPTWEEFNELTKPTKGAVMAKLNYNQDEASKSSSTFVTRVPGTWEFAIKDAELKTANSGTEGINITMEVNQDGTLLKAFDTFWLSDKALFRLADVSAACGQALPEEDTDMIGWTGKAQFDIDDKGYFKVERYIKEGAEAPKTAKKNFANGEKADW